MARKPFRTTRETETGRNTHFENPWTGRELTRGQFVKEIERGDHPGYHVRKINGVDTPVSNPDGKPGNNLD